MSDIKSISQVGGDWLKSNNPQTGGVGPGPSFKDTLAGLQTPSTTGAGATSASAQALKFSNHALERMRSRGIAMGPDGLSRLQNAVEKADKKGSKDSLVLMGDSAFVVSVKNKTVVTVMDRSQMKDNVFTNIDSTVIL